MKAWSKFALGASAIALAGMVGVASLASAQPRGSWDGSGRDGGWHERHGGGYHHWQGRKGRRHGWRRDGGKRGKGGRMRYMMEQFDANDDGKLTKEEIQTGKAALMERHDANGDGNLTLDEFKQVWMEMHDRRIVRAFQFLDIDGSAEVTGEEFDRPINRMMRRMDRDGDGVIEMRGRGARGGMMRGKRWKKDGMDDDNGDAADETGDDTGDGDSEG